MSCLSTSCRPAGFEIMSLSSETGADLFLCPGGSLLICFQGHPEYDELALLKEYRRDVGRYLRAERAAWPDMPQGYFPRRVLPRWRNTVPPPSRRVIPQLLGDFPWRSSRQASAALAPAGVTIYRNWLTHLAALRAAAASARSFQR